MTPVSKNLPGDKQVREKLVNQGAESLSDVELLSILLREGTQNRSAMESADALYESFGGSLLRMSGCKLDELRKRENLGMSRSAMIAAALELGRRFRAGEIATRDTIRTDKDVIEIFQPLLAHLPYEEFWIVYLSSSNRILDKVRISQGGTSKTVVDHKLIVKRALEKLAQAIILVHNHPSGNPQPSAEDEEITEKVTRAASLFEITVADHVIITSEVCYSFRNHGFFDTADE